MPRPSNTQVRREQIVAAMLEVMSSRGYDRASVGEIARAAGLASGVVHYHFRDKQEILLEVVGRLREVILGRTAALVAKAGKSSRARVDAWIDAHLALGDGADPKAVAAWVMLGAEAIRQPEVQRVYAQAVAADFEVLQSLCSEALNALHGSRAGARSVSAALMAAVQGYFVLSAAAPALTPRGSAALAVKRMADGLLHAQG